MQMLRNPSVQMNALRSRCWFKTQITRKENDMREDDLQEMWLWLMHSIIYFKVPENFRFIDVAKNLMAYLLVD